MKIQESLKQCVNVRLIQLTLALSATESSPCQMVLHTSSIRHYIRKKHPLDWVRLKTEEKTKAETATALQSEADRVLAELEGDPDELEDLTQVISINVIIFELFLLTTLIPALFLLLSYLLFSVLSAVIFVIFNSQQILCTIFVIYVT